ncbi:MAG: hypothetical protein IKZ00_03000 [Bacteroidaceae bacterium]|nr:hypothetical protein [Bacteroidaceae bacterium]
MAEKSFPLENTMYTAADAQLWFATRTSGVYADGHLGVSSVGTMDVTLHSGILWLHYDQFAGCVYANTDNLVLTVEMSDASFNRIDRVCIRLEMLNNKCYAYIKKGTPASNPVPPELQRDNVAYEISVAQILVGVGVTAINAGDITDERLDAGVCGLMSDGVTGIDTSVIHAQVSALIRTLQENLQAVYDGVEMVNVNEITGVLTVDGWTAAAPHVQAIAAAGVLAADKPFVDLDLTGVDNTDDMAALQTAWSNVVKATADANAVSFVALNKPEMDIPVKVKVVR